MSKKNRWNRGETLVEVMAAMVIFLLLMGILQGSVKYSRAALEKSRLLREQNEEICESVRNAKQENNGSKTTMTFQAVSADGEVTGNQVFSVPVIPEKNRQNIPIRGMKPGQWFFMSMGQWQSRRMIPCSPIRRRIPEGVKAHETA